MLCLLILMNVLYNVEFTDIKVTAAVMLGFQMLKKLF